MPFMKNLPQNTQRSDVHTVNEQKSMLIQKDIKIHEKRKG